MEEVNYCDFNHLDADVRLPPRKRLLAGLKKQSCNYPSPSSPLSSMASDYTSDLRNLLSSDSKSIGLSAEEIVDASRSAAIAAAKVAAAARATAEEKAAVAVRAAAAAKSALELVASVSEKTYCNERYIRKSKPKKHVPVQLLYKKRRPVENCNTDEELARSLHRAMNSSPRISKSSDGPACKIHRNGSHKNLHELASEVNSGGSFPKVGNTGKIGKRGLESKPSDSISADLLEMGKFPSSRDLVATYPKKNHGQISEDIGTSGRKRGRIKQKKLSLTLCTIKDRENLKEDSESVVGSTMGEPSGESVPRNLRLFSVNTPSEVEEPIKCVPMPKSKKFKPTPCFIENKIIQPLCSSPTVTSGSLP